MVCADCEVDPAQGLEQCFGAGVRDPPVCDCQRESGGSRGTTVWSQDSFLARPEDVIAFAWSAPMRALAARIGISDVGLRKLLVAQGIVLPPQGHWNRVHAGRKVPPPPKPEPRKPGESGRITLDPRFRGHVAEAGAIPEAGPFASAAVPENLEELRAQELKAIGRIAMTRNLDQPHPALRQLCRRESDLRAKAAASGYPWDQPQWDGPLAQRQLRIVDALFRALDGRGHSAWTRYSQGELELHVTIGGRHFQLDFGGNKNGQRGERAPARDLPASAKLRLQVDFRPRSALTTHWDEADGRFEQRIGEIAADLIVVGEAAFRQGLIEAREWHEQRRSWAEEARRTELRKLGEKRLVDLRQSGELLREAMQIRVLVAEVGAAVRRGGLAVTSEQLARWTGWALAEADRLDPVRSGQVLSHLVVPALDDADGAGLEPGLT